MPRVNLFRECRDLNLKIWECPSFLFVIMGIMTLAAMISTYLVARHYDEPEITIISIFVVTVLILTVGHSIIRGVERIAEASRMKSEFVAIASHQLRTPLTALKWSVEAMEKNHLDEKQKEYLKLIKESDQRMINLVNDLLNVSRIEQGRLEIKSEPTDLVKITEEVSEELLPLAKARNVIINFSKEENLPMVMTDSTKIRMVIQNLCGNAIQYIKGKGKVEMNLSRKNNDLVFEVKDNGVGIPSYQQKQIFKKFFRSDNILKHETQGTGLGLFIAQAVVNSSGGKVWFESKENKGTTFWFSLPLKKGDKKYA